MSGDVDFLSLSLGNGPSEWPEVDPELIELLRPDPVYGLITPEQLRRREEIAGTRWYVLRNIHRFRSKDTKRVEDYFTVGGVMRPFHGLAAIYAVLADILPAQQLPLEALETVVRYGAVEPISAQRAAMLRLEILRRTGRDVRPRKHH